MIREIELDRKEEKRTKVRVQITFPNVKSYKTNAEALKTLTKNNGAIMAVKMV